MYKRSYGTRIWIMADKLNISQTDVREIIQSYISCCKVLLYSGNEISFYRLAVLTPTPLASGYKYTFAMQCKEVCSTTHYGYHTVYTIVREYLDFLQEDLLSGHSVDIRGIVSLHPVFKNGELVNVNSVISTAIKRDLVSESASVTTIRAHTNKLLKYSIKRSIEV